jgi:nucleoid-associated protein YgaU
LNTITDYYAHKRKAYSGFLTRDEDILLQTSFERLYRCARSRLYWAACLESQKTMAATEDKIVDIITTQAAAKSKADDKDIAARTPAGKQQAETIETDKKVIAANSAANNGIPDKTGNGIVTAAAKAAADHSKYTSEQASQRLVANADYSASSQSAIKHDSSDTNAQGKSAISNKLRHTDTKIDNPGSNTAGAGSFASNLYTSGTDSKLTGSRPGSNHNFATNRPASSERTAAAHTYSPSRPLDEISENRSAGTRQYDAPERQWQSESYNKNVVDENEPDEEKRNLLPLAAALLALCALGLGSMYLLDDGNGPAIKRPYKVTGTRESSSSAEVNTTDYSSKLPVTASVMDTDRNTIDTHTSTTNTLDTASDSDNRLSDQDTANLIESTPTAESLEKDTLNEIAQEAAAIAVPSTNPRVIELHVNEQPDTPLAAITNPEPVTHQQYSVLGTQEFTHVVIKGDTLWHITRRYLGNPYRYPELAESSQISNPHLIYPGDVIRITVTRTMNQ